jgi:hypothetical protein
MDLRSARVFESKTVPALARRARATISLLLFLWLRGDISGGRHRDFALPTLAGRHDLLGRIGATSCAPQGIVKSARPAQISGQAGAYPANVGQSVLLIDAERRSG